MFGILDFLKSILNAISECTRGTNPEKAPEMMQVILSRHGAKRQLM
jgi:hypothetical protein